MQFDISQEEVHQLSYTKQWDVEFCPIIDSFLICWMVSNQFKHMLWQKAFHLWLVFVNNNSIQKSIVYSCIAWEGKSKILQMRYFYVLLQRALTQMARIQAIILPPIAVQWQQPF